MSGVVIYYSWEREREREREREGTRKCNECKRQSQPFPLTFTVFWFVLGQTTFTPYTQSHTQSCEQYKQIRTVNGSNISHKQCWTNMTTQTTWQVRFQIIICLCWESLSMSQLDFFSEVKLSLIFSITGLYRSRHKTPLTSKKLDTDFEISVFLVSCVFPSVNVMHKSYTSSYLEKYNKELVRLGLSQPSFYNPGF